MFSVIRLNRRPRISGWLVSGAVLAVMSAIVGCGGGDGVQTVSGTVTFEGVPVAAGTVTFEDSDTGFADQTDLETEGTYSIELPTGAYQVGITPPIVEIGGGVDTPPDEDYADVGNIPARYRNAFSSGLTAQVSSDQAELNFDMAP